MRSRPALLYSFLFFVSGAAGLVYELLWVRVLYQSFGSTIQSVTTVVAAYMGGLGLGAWLFGKMADRSRRPAALYGWLEIAIGVFGILSPLVLGVAHRIYIGTAGALELGGGASVALRFGLAAVVLLIPTTLMGGTLPVLTRAFMGDDRTMLKPSLGRLYGLNTLGAVTGTALAGFLLIEFVGVRASLWATAIINIVIGAAAIWLAREQSPSHPGREPGVQERSPRDSLRTLALVLLALTAFASLLDEIAWTRVLVMIVGGSTYAFTLVLLVFLLGIGLGSIIAARGGANFPRAETAASAAVAQGVTGAGAALLFLFFSALPSFIIAIFQIADLGAVPRLLLMGVAIGAVVLLPALGMGVTFPLLADLTAREREARGSDVGAAYALNTIGSILGAVLTGFVLVVVLGTQATLRLGLIINAVAALALAVWAARGIAEHSVEDRRLRTRVISAGVLGMVALVVAVAAPGWSTRLIDLGPTIYARQRMDRTARRQFLEHRGARQLAYREGPNATVSVWEGESGRSLRVNGKVDASDRGDMDTQIMVGLAPLAARPHASSAFLIGYGSGVTARVLAAAPGMRRVRVAEIEPAVLQMDSLFYSVNDTVSARQGVEIVAEDARSALQLDRARYEIIVSEPSNPWVAGVATLYTPEFFRIAKARLSGDGVFSQWIQLYQLPLPIVAGIVRNLREVFPHVHVWFGASVDLVVLASDRPLTYDRAWLEQLIGSRGPMHDIAREWLSVEQTEQYFSRWLLDDAGVDELIGRANLEHRDDQPSLEFAAARRFLDPGPAVRGVFDSLVQMGNRSNAGASFSLVRMLALRGTEPGLSRYLDAARQAQPVEPEWVVRAAALRLTARDTAGADSLLRRAFVLGDRAQALLMMASIATARRRAGARVVLNEALAAGADTAQVRAALALLAAHDSLWHEVATQTRMSLQSARGTFRHPFPPLFLSDALRSLALDGPPQLADSVLRYAVGRRPGSSRLLELSGVAALRAGRCEEAAASFIELLDFGVDKEDGPALVRDCWAKKR